MYIYIYIYTCVTYAQRILWLLLYRVWSRSQNSPVSDYIVAYIAGSLLLNSTSCSILQPVNHVFWHFAIVFITVSLTSTQKILLKWQ